MTLLNMVRYDDRVGNILIKRLVVTFYVFQIKAVPSENPYKAPQVVDHQTESSHDFSNIKRQKLSINVRAVLIFALTGLAISWFIFFIVQLPWIVPADSDFGCGLSLYPRAEVWHYPYRLSMHLLLCSSLSFWAWHCQGQR
jgi:hypothetical protein